VAFAQREKQIAVRREGDRPRSVERRAGERRAVRRRLRFACSRMGCDRAGLQIQPSNAMVADVADQQAAIAIDRDAVRLTELRLRAGTPMPLEAVPPLAATLGKVPVPWVHFALKAFVVS